MNKVFRLMSFLCCLLILLAIAGCYDAGYKRAKPLDAAARLGELSDEFTKDITRTIAPQEETVTKEPVTVAKTDDDASADEPAVDEEPVTVTDATDAMDTSSQETQGATPKVTVTEGNPVRITVAGSDPDGDAVTYTYSPPLDQNGQWQTKRGDANVYEVYVTATDEFGKSTTKSVIIEVLKANSPPVISVPDTIEVFEGETVKLDVAISDEDKEDTVESTISGWMSTTSRTTGFDDAGSHTVTITATDDKDMVSKDVTIMVKNVNRAPEFEIVIG